MGVLAREQRNATVTATSPMMLVTLDRWDVKKLAKLAPTAVEHFQELVEQRRAARPPGRRDSGIAARGATMQG